MGEITRMTDEGEQGLQLVRSPHWSKKGYYIRRRPFHYLKPTRNMLLNRLQFSKNAISVRGKKGLREGLPLAADKIKTSTLPVGRVKKKLLLTQNMMQDIMVQMRNRGIGRVTIPEKTEIVLPEKTVAVKKEIVL